MHGLHGNGPLAGKRFALASKRWVKEAAHKRIKALEASQATMARQIAELQQALRAKEAATDALGNLAAIGKPILKRPSPNNPTIYRFMN